MLDGDITGCTWRSEDTVRGQLSGFTMCVQRTRFRSSSLAARAFLYLLIRLSGPVLIFIKYFLGTTQRLV